ncbi:hypothetical protein N9L38_01910 [Candidatus Poseidoniales archaeon]|nr:hypothetical protein [Candidatus Poseidoniales archaeon]
MIFGQQKKKTDGLVRIIMIKSGHADYVEIEPHSSVHLVGDNGIGKSMILATIQFLMIDDWNRGKMKLSNGALKHKEFYFPTAKSYVIFELESLEGVRHLYVIRGMGKTNNFEIEKWAAEGCWYDEGIFIDNNDGESNVRPWDEIRDNLLKESSNLQKISNKQERIRLLKNWMGWFGKSNLGEDFSDLYLKFLKLGSIKESELKKHIISSAVPENMTTRIDISEDYSRTWREIVGERENLRVIKSLEDKLTKLITKHDDLTGRKLQLLQRWINLEKTTQKWSEDAEEDSKLLNKKKRDIDEELELVKIDKRKIDAELERNREDVIRKEESIKTLRKTESFAESFDLDMSTIKRNDLQKEFDSLSSQIGAIENLTEEIIQRNIKRLEKDKIKLNRIVFKQASTLLASIKKSSIENSHVVNAFRIINPDLLYSEGLLEDESKAKAWIKTLNDSINGSTAKINGISMEVGDPIALDMSLEDAKLELNECIKELDEWNKKFLAYSDSIPYVSKRESIREEIAQIEINISKYNTWINEGKNQLDKTLSVYQELTDLKRELKEKRSMNLQSKETFDEQLKDIERRLSEFENVNETLRKYRDISNLINIDSVPKAENLDFEANQLVGLISQLHVDCTDYYREEHAFSTDFHKIQASLSHSISGIERVDFIEEAREKISGLETLQKNVQDLWFELSNNISGTAGDLMKSLREVERKVSSINSNLRKKKITNIEEIHLDIDKNDTKVKAIIRASSGHALMNFATKEHQTHFREMDKLFQEKPRIELIDLFNLDLYIKKPGDPERRKIGSIDRSGSEGQITAIKSHLLMILLSEVLGKERSRIPIFLDETGKLGSTNYKQILDMSAEVGIQIMTASPSPVEFAEIQHAIVGYGVDNRLRIRPKQYWSSITSEEEV